MNVRPAAHGGNLTAIGHAYGIDPRELLDFSANINPLGPPRSLVDALREAADDVEELVRYPEPTYAALRATLGRVCGVDSAAVVVGNGGAALIDATIGALDIGRALVPTPAFSEYGRALAARGARFVGAPLDRSRDFALDCERIVALAREHTVDCVLLTSPHNPTGATVARDDVLRIAEIGEREGWTTVVDEAFADYDDAQSVTHEAARARTLVVIRSLTKFYAVPALRVGFAVANVETARRIGASLPSWPVTTLAARALDAAIDDVAYVRETRAANAAARTALAHDLRAIGLRPLPCVANYLCVELPAGLHSGTVVARAIVEHRIAIRDCADYDGLEDGRFIRVGVRGRSDNCRLVAALDAIRSAEKAGMHEQISDSRK